MDTSTVTTPTATLINPEISTTAAPDHELQVGSIGSLTAIYSTIEAAQAVVGSNGQSMIVSAKKNNTKGAGVEDGWQVHCVVPSFLASIDSLGDWTDVVNSVLLSQARESLKQWRTSNPMNSQIPLARFSAAQLREDFLSGGDSGSFTKEELEKSFCAGRTWQDIIASDKYKVNPQYRLIAQLFKDKVLLLAGRSFDKLSDKDLDVILSKLHEVDLSSSFGAFVVRKVEQIRKIRSENGFNEIDLDAL